VNTPCFSAVCRCKHQVVKTDSKKRSLRVGKFIVNVYDIYYPRSHCYYGTDADHLPVIPGNNFTSDDNHLAKSPSSIPRVATRIRHDSQRFSARVLGIPFSANLASSGQGGRVAACRV
jgi:hypothetical protein